MSAFCVRLSPPHSSNTILLPRESVIHPVSRSCVDAQFPHAFANGRTIPEQSPLQPIDPQLDGRKGDRISDGVQPFPIRNALVARLVMKNHEDGVHGLLSFIDDITSSFFRSAGRVDRLAPKNALDRRPDPRHRPSCGHRVMTNWPPGLSSGIWRHIRVDDCICS